MVEFILKISYQYEKCIDYVDNWIKTVSQEKKKNCYPSRYLKMSNFICIKFKFHAFFLFWHALPEYPSVLNCNCIYKIIKKRYIFQNIQKFNVS